MSVATTWGTSPDERRLAFSCDRLLPEGEALYRGITIDAPPALVFRWLCQMRVAPYSYDWIDNRGRRSPRELTPGLDELALGQTVMGCFAITDFERARHIALRLRECAFEARFIADVAVSYCVVPNDGGSRLLVKLLVRYRRGPLGWLLRPLLAWGDLIMMRKQLLNFKQLAERDAQARSLSRIPQGKEVEA